MKKKIYARVIFQMYLHKEAFIADQPGGKFSLYALFARLHGDTKNNMYHFTSAFPFAHKAYLWMYESALIYVALKDGPTMVPPITQAEACAITLPYWQWETGYSNGNWDNIINTDVLLEPELFGDLTPVSQFVDSGLFNSLTTVFCVEEHFPLKRAYTPIIPYSFDLPWLIYNKTTFSTFIDKIHSDCHSLIHNYIGGLMAITRTAGYDPLFFMHHCNVDRIWHAWVDCRGWEFLQESELTTKQYMAINPLKRKDPSPVKDIYGYPVKVSLDDTVNFYVDSSTATFLPQNSWPLIKQLWSTGTPTKRGWNGIYYRYGADDFISKLTRCPDQNWNLLLKP
jgi:hypothetical protein